MGKKVKKAYEEAGLSPRAGAPEGGKGIHTLAAHQCVIRQLKKGKSREEAWKMCQGALGQHAIKKSHRRRPDDEY